MNIEHYLPGPQGGSRGTARPAPRVPCARRGAGGSTRPARGATAPVRRRVAAGAGLSRGRVGMSASVLAGRGGCSGGWTVGGEWVACHVADGGEVQAAGGHVRADEHLQGQGWVHTHPPTHPPTQNTHPPPAPENQNTHQPPHPQSKPRGNRRSKRGTKARERERERGVIRGVLGAGVRAATSPLVNSSRFSPRAAARPWKAEVGRPSGASLCVVVS